MIEVTWETLPLTLLTLAVAVIGTARVARIATYDDFPPAMWLRQRWVDMTDGTGWQNLATCFWCATPWLMLLTVGWFLAGLLWVPWLTVAWWIFYGWMALSYLASQYILFDEGGE